MTSLTRRQLLAGGLGAVGAVAAGGVISEAWALIAREDLVPGRPPQMDLRARAWTASPDHLSFAAIGDSGSGGRQAMAVAERMALTYQREPFGVVSLLGDIVYYGSVEDRFDDAFVRPMTPLIDAGVEFELAVGNHEGGIHYGDEDLHEIEATLERLGTPGRYYTVSRGPADFFYLDSSGPGVFEGGRRQVQLDWLDSALADSDNQWKIVALHHPVYSSGRHGSTERLQEHLEPVLLQHKVDLVLAGHDHHYERTVPIGGITHVVSGGGCKTTGVRPRRFTAAAASALEFLKLDIDGDRLVARAIRPTGEELDRFELRAREGR